MRIYLVSAAGGFGYYTPSSQGSPHTIALSFSEDVMRAYQVATSRGAINRMTDLPAEKITSIRLLLSYHYFRTADLGAILKECFTDHGVAVDVFADSGAYSAMTTGAKIELAEYAAWLKQWSHLITCAATLDVINEPVGSWKNTLDLMETDHGVKIVPVVHALDPKPFMWLETHFKTGFDYIGLAALSLKAHGRVDLVAPFFKKAFDICPPNVKYHGFGMTTWKYMRAWPWYSIDSSSWISGFRFASMWLFDPRRRAPVHIDMTDRASLLANSEVLYHYGILAKDMTSHGYDQEALIRACIRSWQAAEEHLSKRVYLVSTSGTAPNSPRKIAKAISKG